MVIVRCFVRGLQYRLRVDTEHLVSASCSFLDVVYHARSMEHIHREAQGGSDKRARYQGSYSGSQTRGRDFYDRPRQRFQQGLSSRPVQAALLAFERSQHHQGGPSVGQSSRGSNFLPSYRGRVTSGHSASGCFDCGALDHWSRECPGEGEERLYQLPLHLDQFQQCPLSLEVVVRTRVVGTADRVPEAELGEAG